MTTQPPTTADLSDRPRACKGFPVAVPMLAVGCATLLGAVVGMGIGLNAGWGNGTADPVIRAGFFAMASWLIAGGIGMVALLGVARGRDDRLGIAVLGSSMARMLVALTIGVGVMTIGNVEGRSFLTVFLCSGLLALGAETVWAMKRSAAMSVETRPPSAATGGTPAGAR